MGMIEVRELAENEVEVRLVRRIDSRCLIAERSVLDGRHPTLVIRARLGEEVGLEAARRPLVWDRVAVDRDEETGLSTLQASGDLASLPQIHERVGIPNHVDLEAWIAPQDGGELERDGQRDVL